MCVLIICLVCGTEIIRILTNTGDTNKIIKDPKRQFYEELCTEDSRKNLKFKIKQKLKYQMRKEIFWINL